VIGRLFGLDPAPAAHCRVLELGCGDATNVLSMGQTLPQSSFVGIDASAAAIERGRELAAAAGLGNVALRVAQLQSLPEDLGEFDYIVSHGVYSWISPEARAGLLDCCGERLRAEGIAYVSYNAYPGSHLRDMTRQILRYHVRNITNPHERLQQAHRLMKTIVGIEEPSLYARALREQMERMLNYSDALLFHDDLAEISTPFYFHEFVEHAAAHGLQFLSEADLSESRMEGVPASAGELFEAVADDPLAREQYMDFFKNRTFRRTLLCHAHAPVRRAIGDIHLERFAISSSARPVAQDNVGEQRTLVTPEGHSVTTSEPLVLAALDALSSSWPAALEFPELLERSLGAIDVPAELAPARLRAILLEAYIARVVQLRSTPPPVSDHPAERPLASPLARAQCAAGLPAVSSLLHANARLEGELEPRLMAMLDGTRDKEALVDALLGVGESNGPPPASAQVEEALARLASLGLLQKSWKTPPVPSSASAPSYRNRLADRQHPSAVNR
jgi:cyclopropane fatty-acyl-phospholipid synthase-like methyltransferase